MIYLVRHGQTDWNLSRKIQGQLDIPLNETGKNEALICAKQVGSFEIDAIISSDLSRAKETANIINGFLSLPINYDARLRELNFGTLQGVFSADISEQTWNAFNRTPQQFNAESKENLYKRVKSFFHDLDATKNTLVVTHGGFIRMTMYFLTSPKTFNSIECEKFFREFKIKNTEIFKFEKPA